MLFLIAFYLTVFIFSFFLSCYLSPMVRRFALHFGVVDIPDGKLKKHKKKVAYGGGIAIYLSFIISIMIFYPLENNIFWLLVGITFLLGLGIVDDCKILTPHQKFMGQFLAVICLLKNGFYLKAQFLSVFWNIFFSTFWLLLTINSFNLVDVMDGLASLLAIIATSFFFILSLFMHQYAISILLLIFLGSLFGFFIYNKPPATIYLGDGGSLLIGGFLGSIPFFLPWSDFGDFAYYTPIVILSIPLLEVFFLILIRSFKGIPFYRGSPHHFAIYLQKRGWTIKQVLFFVFLYSFSSSAFACLFFLGYLSLSVLFILGLLYLFIWIAIVYQPFASLISVLRSFL